MKAAEVVEEILTPLRGPVLKAHREARKALERGDVSPEVRQALIMIRSMCGRAENVFSAAHLLQDLNALNLESRLKKYKVAEVFGLIDEMVDDMTALLDPERQLKIVVDDMSFKELTKIRLHVDLPLFGVAVRNVIDNAVRYSFQDSRVDVAARYGSGRFSLVVINRGLKMTAAELKNFVDADYRCGSMLLATGQDAGIGLWLVSRIMQVHNGRLDFLPAHDGMTEVHLELPAEE
jgi:K+-sensing histidine kinase KdpD